MKGLMSLPANIVGYVIALAIFMTGMGLITMYWMDIGGRNTTKYYCKYNFGTLDDPDPPSYLVKLLLCYDKN